jgi:hypothetical protein
VISWTSGFGFGRLGASPFSLGGGGGAGMSAAGLGSLLTIAAFVVFLFFLRSVALAVRARSLANTIKTYLIAAAISIGVGILLSGIAMAVAGAALFSMIGRGGPPTAGGGAVAGTAAGAVLAMVAVACIMVPVVLGMFIWYIVILFQVRGAIDRHLRQV